MSQAAAANAVEEALRTQAAAYDEGDDLTERMFLQCWVGISSWAGIEEGGDSVNRLVLHLNGGELPTWQIIGLLRSMLLQMEATYTRMGFDGSSD